MPTQQPMGMQKRTRRRNQIVETSPGSHPVCPEIIFIVLSQGSIIVGRKRNKNNVSIVLALSFSMFSGQ